MPSERIQAHHLQDLRASGLSDETIDASGCYSAQEPTTRMLLGWGVGPGLVFPFPGCVKADGTAFCQVKPDKAPTVQGRAAKYVTPKESGCRLYIPPILSPTVLQDASCALYLTEGCKKALKATQEGLPTLAFAGVDAWRDRRNGKASGPIPELDAVAWKGRSVYVVYDSDLAWKLPVRMAEFRLARELRQRGAKVSTIRLPNGPDGQKQGLDDYLVRHSVETLCEIEPEEVEHPDKPGAIAEFSVVDLGEFLDARLPVLPNLVGEGVITQSSLVSLVGQAKLGKTWLLTQLGLTIAGLSPCWLSESLPVIKHGKVLYINAEVAESVFQFRLRAVIQQAERAGLHGQARRQFYPVSVRGKLKLDRKAGEDQIRKLADKIQPVCIILDPIGPLHGWDENSADEMGRLLNILLGLCTSTGATIIFAHHATKAAGQKGGIYSGRGSSVFGDRVDSAISLITKGEQEHGSRLRMDFVLRNGPPHEPLVVFREPDSFLYRAISETADIARWVLDQVSETGRLPYDELHKRWLEEGNTTRWPLRKALESLRKVGKVDRAKEAFSGEWTLILSR